MSIGDSVKATQRREAGGPSPLATGRVLARRFELLDRIGVGGFGEVWRARHLHLGVEVALKVLGAEAAQHGEIEMIEERFRFEAQVSALLAKKTAHVAVVHDAGVSEVGPFLAMELIVGRSLEAMIDERPLAPEEVSRLLAPIAEALDAAHAAGIVHRDLKPANVLVGEGGVVKVIDFGIAKAVGFVPRLELPKETDARFFVGTPEYMSPEQLRAGGPLTAASDLWALGVLAYEALTAKMPFGGESAAETMARIAERGFTPPSLVRSELGPAVDAWFARALAKDPSARFACGREAAEAFALAIQPRTTSRRRPSRLSEAPPISIVPPELPSRGTVGSIVSSVAIGLAFVATLAAVSERSRPSHADVASRVAPAFVRAARVAAASRPRSAAVVEAPPPAPPEPTIVERDGSTSGAVDVEALPDTAPKPAAPARPRDKSSIF